ncbi:Phox-like protein [Cristinia sonorae]|uniref:Endosomal/vacuolar adapter protein YPT35 n=1 Tax=Cristinia sonorae TaxID=1940300 RepID=A0A8K0URW8_9AGAR|nr:Phox-like protein [Cristinia sonorae]
MADAQPQSSSEPQAVHPFANSNSLIVVIPDNIDVEEEARLYEELCDAANDEAAIRPESPHSAVGAPSVFSNDIWLGEGTGQSTGFARDVQISGWTRVGDKREGAYIVYDCAISTKEGTVMHVHKRYSDFAELHARLRATLPQYQQRFLPAMPPKSPLSKFRPTFLESRRRLLQHWLSSILLHPEIGGCQAVREWMMAN